MHLDLCRHIRTNGLQCQGVALTKSPFCYFHDRLHKRHARYRFTPATQGYLIPGQHIQLGPLEDREAVQVALSQVINALATGALEAKRATALLYGLQLASNNAAGVRLAARPFDSIRETCTTPDESDTPGIDLAQPGAFYETDTEPAPQPESAATNHQTSRDANAIMDDSPDDAAAWAIADARNTAAAAKIDDLDFDAIAEFNRLAEELHHAHTPPPRIHSISATQSRRQ